MNEDPTVTPTTADAFLLARGEDDTTRELIDGTVITMAAESGTHAAIVDGVRVEVGRRIMQRHVVVNALVPVDRGNVYKADLVVPSDGPSVAGVVADPVLAVEVLPSSTFKTDLAIKLQRYIAMASVREVWLIDARERWVQVWRRGREAWFVTLPSPVGGRFRSNVLEDEVSLDRLYRNSGL